MINHVFKKAQRRNLLILIGAFFLVLGISTLLISKPKEENIINTPKAEIEEVTTSFNDANLESALDLQQKDIDDIKADIKGLRQLMLKKEQRRPKPKKPIKPKEVIAPSPSNINAVSFAYKKQDLLKANDYVPSGTFVSAIILGGADSDASVNGQSKNNGVMLFKLISDGQLPNSAHANLKGCFVTGSSYGDISSERAFVILDRLSCAPKGKPIIDKAVTGWAFFGGKVGIKGKPLMRDNKVMQWAGVSGAMSGIASVAGSLQNTNGAAGNAATLAASGGITKASEVLSNYYVKRAEQYHPVIQVGAGSIVTIVFKDGFELKSDSQKAPEVVQETSDFEVPEAILNRIQKEQ